MTIFSTLALFCTALVIVSVLGGALPLATVLNHTRLQVYLSFSAGTMLGAAFFHMLPEAVRVGAPETVWWTAIGLLALFFLERFFSFHHHEPEGHGDGHDHGRETEDDHARDRDDVPAAASVPRDGPRSLSWGPAAVGLAVHSLAGGMALASAVTADFRIGAGALGAGLGVFVATFVHKPADAITITSLMLRDGAQRRPAHLVNLAFALMVPLGVVLFEIGTCLPTFSSATAETWTAAVLAFSAGTFLCIALSDLLPELQFHSHDRLKLSAALLAGFALMAATALVEPERARASASSSGPGPAASALPPSRVQANGAPNSPGLSKSLKSPASKTEAP